MTEPVRKSLPIYRIIENPRNDRIHPLTQIERLQESLRKFGQPYPVLVRKENNMLISGHAVWRSMKELGETKIDTLVWDVDQPTADAFLLAANRLGELSFVDPARRRELLIGIAEEDRAAVGFLPDDVEELLALDREEIAVREVETSPVGDTFWISLRGPLPDQARVLQKLREVMAEFSLVEVTLGTLHQEEPLL